MKREKYVITYNNDQKTIKFKWNSALREIERIVREIAKSENTYYELIDKSQNTEFTEGCRIWKGLNGKTLNFKIKKEIAE